MQMVMSPRECWWDGGGRGDLSGDKHKLPGAARGHSTVWESAWRTWLQHCWPWCWWSPTSVREVSFYSFIFMTQHDWYLNLSVIIMGNEHICVTCLCDSTAEKIVSDGLPSESQREAWVRVFSRRLQHRDRRGWRSVRSEHGICKYICTFDANRGCPTANIYPILVHKLFTYVVLTNNQQ